MPVHRVELAKSAERELRRLPRRVRRRFESAFEEIQQTGLRVTRLDIAKMSDRPGMWRLRIGQYRGVFLLDGETVVFTTFGDRSKIYRA